jgi:hypothetical protein
VGPRHASGSPRVCAVGYECGGVVVECAAVEAGRASLLPLSPPTMDAHAELADLQNRFHLLEGDRKAFYEQSQLTLKQNKEVCDTLRLENKDLRLALGSLSKERGGGGESNAMLDAESDKIEVRLALLRKRQNQLQDANRTKDRSMDTLDDELRDLQRSSSRPAAEANPLMRQIRTLENRLDKATIKRPPTNPNKASASQGLAFTRHLHPPEPTPTPNPGDDQVQRGAEHPQDLRPDRQAAQGGARQLRQPGTQPLG